VLNIRLDYLAGLDDVDKEGGFFSDYGLATEFAEALHEPALTGISAGLSPERTSQPLS
jgi:hypothetical protein